MHAFPCFQDTGFSCHYRHLFYNHVSIEYKHHQYFIFIMDDTVNAVKQQP